MEIECMHNKTIRHISMAPVYKFIVSIYVNSFRLIHHHIIQEDTSIKWWFCKLYFMFSLLFMADLICFDCR